MLPRRGKQKRKEMKSKLKDGAATGQRTRLGGGRDQFRYQTKDKTGTLKEGSSSGPFGKGKKKKFLNHSSKDKGSAEHTGTGTIGIARKEEKAWDQGKVDLVWERAIPNRGLKETASSDPKPRKKPASAKKKGNQSTGTRNYQT